MGETADFDDFLAIVAISGDEPFCILGFFFNLKPYLFMGAVTIWKTK